MIIYIYILFIICYIYNIIYCIPAGVIRTRLWPAAREVILSERYAHILRMDNVRTLQSTQAHRVRSVANLLAVVVQSIVATAADFLAASSLAGGLALNRCDHQTTIK